VVLQKKPLSLLSNGLIFPPETIIMCVVVFICLFNIFAMQNGAVKKKSLYPLPNGLIFEKISLKVSLLACLLPERTGSKIDVSCKRCNVWFGTQYATHFFFLFSWF